MEKLTLEHIAPYLPYGLKIKATTGIQEVKGLINDKKHIQLINDLNNYIAYLDDCKPILRPMDLTKPIIVEGKEIIPIVELAFIAFPGLDWEQGEIKKHTAISSHFTNNNFQYRNGEFITQNLNMEIVQTGNQLALFQWLFKNKFDLFSLIEKGLAIDVNTLTTNPYN